MAQNRYFTSGAPPTTLSSSLASTGNPSVAGITGLPSSYPFTMLIDWGLSTQEAISVTSAPTGSGPYALPCTRGIDGTTAQSHIANAQVVHGFTAEDFNEPQAHINGFTSGVSGTGIAQIHGLASGSSVVGTTDTQTLTNKSLTSPALTSVPTAPTASALTDSTQVATTAYADSAVAVETSRAETAEALLAPLASPALTGTPTAPTKTALTSNTDIATTAYADSAVAVETSRAETAEALALPKSGGTLTGLLALAGTRLAWSTKTGAYSLAATDDVVLGNATSAAFTLSLPTASSAGTGKVYVVSKTDSSANAVTVTPNGSNTISGVNASSILATQYDLLILVSDGT